jgi:hypothetical protein
MTDQNQRPTPPPPPADPRHPQPDTEPITVILAPHPTRGPGGTVLAGGHDTIEEAITLLAHSVLAILVIIRARRRHSSATELILTVARVLVRAL